MSNTLQKHLSAIENQSEQILQMIEEGLWDELDVLLNKRQGQLEKLFSHTFSESEKPAVLNMIQSILKQDEQLKEKVKVNRQSIAQDLIKLKSQKSAIKAYTTDHEQR